MKKRLKHDLCKEHFFLKKDRVQSDTNSAELLLKVTELADSLSTTRGHLVETQWCTVCVLKFGILTPVTVENLG
jgi:hypothetical protein